MPRFPHANQTISNAHHQFPQDAHAAPPSHDKAPAARRAPATRAPPPRHTRRDAVVVRLVQRGAHGLTHPSSSPPPEHAREQPEARGAKSPGGARLLARNHVLGPLALEFLRLGEVALEAAARVLGDGGLVAVEGLEGDEVRGIGVLLRHLGGLQRVRERAGAVFVAGAGRSGGADFGVAREHLADAGPGHVLTVVDD